MGSHSGGHTVSAPRVAAPSRSGIEPWRLAMLIGGACLLLGTLWVGWRAYQAYSHLAAARAVVSDMTAELADQGMDALPALARDSEEFAKETAGAHSAVADPLYRVATVLPWLGNNLEAVRQVAVTMDGIAQAATDGLPALTPLADHGQWASGGRYDLEVIRPAVGAIVDLDSAVHSAITAMTQIDRHALAGPVSDALGEYGGQLLKLADITTPGAQAAQVALPLLGGDGPRTYLIAFQNAAEARATGGILGFYAELHVDDGTLTLGETGSSDRGLGPFDSPVVDLDPALAVMYGPGMALYPQNVNLTPDFPTAARTFAAMYQQSTGREVDGVVALDPVVVGRLLRGVAPIELGRGLTLTSDTAVDVMLRQLYEAFPGGDELAERDQFTGTALRAAFESMLGNVAHLDPLQVIDDVRDSISERRLLLWSSHADDESLLETTAVGGRLGRDEIRSATFGIFLNDFTGAKLSYYLRGGVTIDPAGCAPAARNDGDAAAPASVPVASVEVTLENTAPDGLPNYVLGEANIGKAPDQVVNLVLVSPTDAEITSIEVDGKPITAVAWGSERDRQTANFTVTLPQGKDASVRALVSLSADAAAAAGDAAVTPVPVVTPLAMSLETSATALQSCGT